MKYYLKGLYGRHITCNKALVITIGPCLELSRILCGLMIIIDRCMTCYHHMNDYNVQQHTHAHTANLIH